MEPVKLNIIVLQGVRFSILYTKNDISKLILGIEDLLKFKVKCIITRGHHVVVDEIFEENQVVHVILHNSRGAKGYRAQAARIASKRSENCNKNLLL